MSFANAANGWIIGSLGSFNATKGVVLYHTANSGTSWTKQLLTPWTIGLFVQFVDVNSGWAVVGNGSGLNNMTSGALIRTTNGGASWTILPAASGIPYFIDANNGWSITSSSSGVPVNHISHTTDGGNNWSTQLTDSSGGGFIAIQFVDGNNGWVVGDSGKVLRTTNSGTTWTRITNTGNNSTHKALFFLDANIGWIGGRPFSNQGPAIVLHTTNGGGSWSVQSTPSQYGIFCIRFTDANNGWFTADYGGFAKTTSGGATAVQENGSSIPDLFELEQNYPNPFNPSTVISYQLPANSHVILKVYDVLGREVETLLDERQSAGNHYVRLNATTLSSGVYFYRLEAGMYHDTRKMLLLK